MLRVGIIDIDTTQPWWVANYINATGKAQVVGITDGGGVWPPEQARDFAQRLNPPAQVFETPEGMLGKVDAVLSFGKRYDLRIQRIRPFLDDGVPVYVDSPAVGTLGDVRCLESYLKMGKRLFLGSSMAFAPELEEVWKRVTAGSPCGLSVVGWKDLFEFGIHGADIAMCLVQSYPVRVQWGVYGPTECVWIETAKGQDLLLHTGLPQPQWQVSCMTGDGIYNTMLNLGLFRGCQYDLLARAFVEFAETGRTPFPPHWHLEAIKIFIAAKRSRDEGRTVTLDELNDSDGFDGKDYGETCRRMGRWSNRENALSPAPAALMKASADDGASGASLLSKGIAGRVLRKGKRVTKRVLGPQGTRIVKRIGKQVLGSRGTAAVKRLVG